jgi:hypothetical protein
VKIDEDLPRLPPDQQAKLADLRRSIAEADAMGGENSDDDVAAAVQVRLKKADDLRRTINDSIARGGAFSDEDIDAALDEQAAAWRAQNGQ